MTDKIEDLESWFRNVVDDVVLDAQRRLVGRMVQQIFGYCSVESSVVDGGLGIKPRTGNHWVAQYSAAQAPKDIYCSPAAWPFVNEDVDAVFLHHTLDYAQNQAEVFRDSCRIVKAGGYIVIVGFNPYSLLTPLRWCLAGRRRSFQYRPFSLRRLTDWLELMSFQVQDVRFEHALPWGGGALRNKVDAIKLFNKAHLGSFYCVVARKSVLTGYKNGKRHALKYQAAFGQVSSAAVTKKEQS